MRLGHVAISVSLPSPLFDLPKLVDVLMRTLQREPRYLVGSRRQVKHQLQVEIGKKWYLNTKKRHHHLQ